MIPQGTSPRPATRIDDTPPFLCPRCDYRGPHTHGPGAGPHYARLLCGQCQRFLRWIRKPRPVEVSL